MSAARLLPHARPATRAALLAAPLVAALGAAPARAHAQQSLANRVARAGDGLVRFRYAVREGVCGDSGRSITITGADGTSRYGSFGRSGDDGTWSPAPCEPGPARVTLVVRGGVPRAVRLAVGGSPRDGADARADARADAWAERVVDLGAVSAPAAAAYLLDLAARADVPSPDRVLLGAVVADSGVPWPRLLGLARDERLPRATRREATFWAGQAACDAITAARLAAPRPLAGGDTADRDVRKQVVFALSQRPADEHTATLVRVARTDRDPAVRCAALFWLGQSANGRTAVAPRTLDLFEAVLRGR